MKTVTLQFMTPQGHEIGRRPVRDVVVAGVGDSNEPVRPGLERSMDGVYAALRSAVASEGMAIATGDREFEVLVSRSLLQDASGDEILIPVPVQERPQSDRSTGGNEDPPVDKPITLDDLFNLDSSDSEASND